MSAPLLRGARATDAGAVGAILSGFIDETPWMPRLHSRAEDLAFAGHMIARGWVRVVEVPDGIVAFIARDGAEVHALYVAAPAQGQGHGSRLLREAQTACRDLRLATFQANTGAQRFYQRHGFVEIGRSDGHANDEGLPDLTYRWRVAQDAVGDVPLGASP